MTTTPLARMIGAAFGAGDEPLPLAKPASRRRKKLWELPAHWHCAVVGTCFNEAELRRLGKRGGHDDPGLSEYLLHTRVVNACESRGPLAETIQRRLDERHAIQVRRFGKAGNTRELLALWDRARDIGDVAGALWAVLTHPDLDEAAGGRVYGDIHMLSHRGCSHDGLTRARLTALEQDNTRLVDETATLQQTLLDLRREHQRASGEMEARLADANRRLQLHARDEARLAAAGRLEEVNAGLKAGLDSCTRRNAELERENASLARRAEALQGELAAARERLVATAAAQEAILAIADEAGEAATDKESLLAGLAGRSIVCVGGRTALVDHYRRLAEGKGARFVHHDGGQEENPHRIDALIAGADIVLCQAGYISHPTYWRLKEACKRRGLPCVFLKSAGVSSFAQGLASVMPQPGHGTA